MSLLTNRDFGDIKMTWRDFFAGSMEILDSGYSWFWRGCSQEYVDNFIKELTDEFLGRFPQPADEMIRALINEQRRRADSRDVRADNYREFKKYFRTETNIVGSNHISKTIWFNESVKGECPMIGNPDIFIERELNGTKYKFYLDYVFFSVPGKDANRCIMKMSIGLVRMGNTICIRYPYSI